MPADLQSFLGPAGVSVMLGFLEAYLFENWQWFQERSAQTKRLIVASISVAFTLAFTAITQVVPAETISQYNVWYLAILAGISLVSAEVSHQKINR